jgi:RNA polymerase sigma-70 factor (ECF subfamily)
MYFIYNLLDYGIYNAFSNIYDARQIIPERPNGGQWIAFGNLFPPNTQHYTYIDLLSHLYSGERHAYMENYLGAKSILLHVYGVEGFPCHVYNSIEHGGIGDENLVKLLRVIDSGVNPADIAFDIELLKAIPWLVKCRILRYDDGRAAIDIPTLSPEEMKCIVSILEVTRNEFVTDTVDVLREYFSDKRQDLPKHLTSVPLIKQYMWSEYPLLMVIVREAMKHGVLHDGDYDNDDPIHQPPPAMVYITAK